MLLFVVTVKARTSAADWPAFSALVRRCVTSLTAQSNEDYRVVVVHSELPLNPLRHPWVDYLQVEFPQPHTWAEMEEDKAQRLLAGAAFGGQFNPTHIMSVDCDDLVSRDLAAHVGTSPTAPGWVITQGYVWPHASPVAFRARSGFQELCGTSLLLRTDLFPRAFSDHDTAFDAVSMRSGSVWFDHRARELQADQGLAHLPFPGAVYCVAHGENIRVADAIADRQALAGGKLHFYIRQAKRFQVRAVSRGFRRDFGI